MARFTFNLPDIGEGITEAEIVAWHVRPGDMVAEDGRLADLMTDKATVEMESPVAGRVLEVAGEEGEVIAIGAALVVIETAGEVAAGSSQIAEAAEASDPTPQPARAELVEAPSPRSDLPPDSPQAERDSPATSSGREGYGKSREIPKVLASPAVRQRARDLGVDLARVRPTEHGRIRHADLDAFLAYNADQGFAIAGQSRADETIKVIGLRRRIAENMAAAKRHIPHFTYVEECDVTELETLRAQLNSGHADRPRLTLLPLLITAMCRAVPRFPMLNARFDDQANLVTRHGAVHMGLATMTAGGLMAPVIHDAQARNLWQLAREITRLAEAARGGSARVEELSGSTMTISSLGPLGGIASTPVINRPEVAILAPNRIVERPVFVADSVGGERIEKRKLMNLSLSCDHRVVDGYDAAGFVQEIKRLIEAPALILAG